MTFALKQTLCMSVKLSGSNSAGRVSASQAKRALASPLPSPAPKPRPRTAGAVAPTAMAPVGHIGQAPAYSAPETHEPGRITTSCESSESHSRTKCRTRLSFSPRPLAPDRPLGHGVVGFAGPGTTCDLRPVLPFG